MSTTHYIVVIHLVDDILFILVITEAICIYTVIFECTFY